MLNLLEPCGPVHACNGTTLPFYITMHGPLNVKFFHLVVKLIIVNFIPGQGGNFPAMSITQVLHFDIRYEHLQGDTSSVRVDEEPNPSF
jgi:hypothetical protein